MDFISKIEYFLTRFKLMCIRKKNITINFILNYCLDNPWCPGVLVAKKILPTKHQGTKFHKEIRIDRNDKLKPGV